MSELEVAEAAHAFALKQFNKAEARFFALPRRIRLASPPDWYHVAFQAERLAAEVKEVVYSKVAATPAASRAAQMTKVRLLVQVYGTKHHEQDEDDLVARLIQSLSRGLRPDLKAS